MIRSLLPVAVVGLALAGCGGIVETSAPFRPAATPTTAATPAPSPTVAATSVTCATPAVTRRLNRVTGIAERQYDRESGGAVVHADLRLIARDSGLRAAARSGSAARLRSYMTARFPAWYHRHVSRLQIMRRGRTLVDVGVPFVVDGPRPRCRAATRCRYRSRTRSASCG